MSESIAIEQGSKPTRLGDVLWSAGLVAAVLDLANASFGGAGATARVIGLIGVALGVAGGALAFRNGPRSLPGPLLAVAVSLFAAIVGGRPNETPIIRLADAPRYVPVKQDDEPELPQNAPGTANGPGATEILNHRGPIALSSDGLLLLAAASFRPLAFVVAEWEGAWYSGRLLSVNGDSARVHFLGWETSWDEDVPRERLRSAKAGQMPTSEFNVPMNAVGSATRLPCAMTVSAYQPAAGFADGTDMKTLGASFTLFSQRLDVTDVAVNVAVPGLATGKPFGLAIDGAVRFDAAAGYFFDVGSDGSAKLWVDDAAVDAGSPINLAEGVHLLRLEYRHDGGPRMTLGLRMGTDPKALRVLDMNRNGVAQAAREGDGSLRLVLSEGVLFDVDKDDLNTSAERALMSIFAMNIAPAPLARVRVEGYTDDRGSDEHNMDLSHRRAERVRGWLIAHGRGEDTVTGQAFGEKHPRVPNDSDAHRKANRRVELVVSPSQNGSSAPPAAKAAAPADQAVVDVLHAYYAT
jgi:outer membrane protein OmpA-like peptidoglycan-associated protein